MRPAKNVGERRRSPAIGHVSEIDLGQILEQLSAHVRRAAMSRRREGELAWVLLRLREDVGDRMERRGRRHHQQVREQADQGDRREVGDRIVADRREQVAVEREPGGGDVHGVAIGSGARDLLGGDVAAGARLVLDHDLLAPHLAEPRAEDAGDAVDAAAGRERHHQLHDAGGPGLDGGLREGRPVGEGRRERGGGREHGETAAGEHVISLP